MRDILQQQKVNEERANRINQAPIPLIGPYGRADTDEALLTIDPAFVAMTDDGEYIAIADHMGDQIEIIEHTGSDWSLKKVIPTVVTFAASALDFRPGTHTLLYYDSTYGGASEYDIDNDSTVNLFTANINNGITYWPSDRSYYQMGEKGGTTAKVVDSSGNIYGTRSATLPTIQEAGTIFWSEAHSTITASAASNVYGIGVYDLSGSLEAQIAQWHTPKHIYARGPYITIGNESDYSLILEESGATYRMYPMRANNLFIRYPKDNGIRSQLGFEFVSPYHFSIQRFSEAGLFRGNINYEDIARQTVKIHPAGGVTQRMTSMIPPGKTATAYAETTAADADTDIIKISIYERYYGGGEPAYPRFFREEQSAEKDFGEMIVKQVTNQSSAEFEISGYTWFTLSLTHSSTSDQTTMLYTEVD